MFRFLALSLVLAPLVRTQDQAVVWRHGPLDASVAAGRDLGRPTLVYFWMDGSTHCANLFGQTLSSPDAAPELAQFVCHSADVSQPEAAALLTRYGVVTLPTLVVLTPDGAVDDAIVGFIPVADFVAETRRIRAGQQTVAALRSAAAASPDDLDLRYALAQKLTFVGAVAEGRALEASIVAADPDGETAAGAGLRLVAVRDGIVASAPDAADPATWELGPMLAALPRLRHAPTRFQGWDWLATVHGDRGERSAQRAAWQRAFDDAPGGGGARWGTRVLEALWNQREELDARDRKLARALAIAVAERAELRARAAAADGGASAPPPPVGDEEELTPARALGAAAHGFVLAGQRRRARAAIERALQLEPSNAELERVRAEVGR